MLEARSAWSVPRCMHPPRTRRSRVPAMTTAQQPPGRLRERDSEERQPMKQLTRNLYVETAIRGCNHGFVTTSDGVVMVAGRQKPSDALTPKPALDTHRPLRYSRSTEPHGDHWTGNAFFDAPGVAHEGIRRRILEATDMQEHVARLAT